MAFFSRFSAAALFLCLVIGSEAATLYSIGEPTVEEQMYVEYINRARANPAAEGQRLKNTSDPQVREAYAYWKVNLDLMAAQMAAIPPAPPLSINPKLTAAARAHSQDMLSKGFQDHTGSNGSTPESRIRAQGYNFNYWGENIFAYVKSVFYGHAGFEVDWGTGGVGGMLVPPYHRNNIHQPLFREIGVGNVKGQNGVYGPQVVTQDFGTIVGNGPFITGVAYRDANGNNFYDMGEGLGGVTVTVSGSSSYAVTSQSGGYSVPAPGNGSFTVSFSAPGFVPQQKNVVVSELANVKVDYLAVASTSTGAKLQLTKPVKISRTQAKFEVTLTGGAASAIDIYAANLATGPWSKDSSVSIEQVAAGRWNVTFNPSTGTKFFKAAPR